MKKLLCAMLMAAMLVTLSALAETAELPAPQTVEQKLEAMIPVLNSLAVSLNVDSQDEAFRQEYDPTDAHLLWNQLWVLCAEWLSNDAAYRTDDGIAIPADVMDACARASFGALEGDLPAIPKTDGESTVRYDAKDDVYDVDPLEPSDRFMVIESYAVDGDQMVVSCGVYNGETKERMGGMTARLNTAVEQGDSPYPFAVLDAHAEARGDFDGLWANLCDIRYTAPEQPAEPPKPDPTATPAPKASTGSSSAKSPAYVKLSTGSKGAAVKNLQQRLKKLGYDCGTADGVYGASTKNAIRYFQDAIGAKQDGVASAKLQQKLFGKKAPKYVQYVKIKKGSKGIRVEKLQSSLRKLGYTAAPVDGSYSDRIVKAVKLFQAAAELKADGVAGEKTLKALAEKNAPECKDFIDMQKGDTGSRVTEMQNALVKLGYLNKANEKYDDTTVKAVAGFKQDYKVKGNGKSVTADVVRMMVAAADTPDPTEQPTTEPTEQPTEQPTDQPTDDPTDQPTDQSTDDPTGQPSDQPKDDDPTEQPSDQPKDDDPTEQPSDQPKDDDPTEQPSEQPKDDPAEQSSEQPSGSEGQSDKDKEAEEEAKRKEEEEKAKAEEERIKAEEEAKRKEEEEKAKAEEERIKAEEEAKRKEEEEKAKAEEERIKAEEEAKRKAEEEKAKAEQKEAENSSENPEG